MIRGLRRALPRSWRRLGRRAFLVVADAGDRWFGRDTLRPPPTLMFIGGGDYEAVGNEFLAHFRTLGGLEPHHRVLDVGCGIGRMAVPLTRYLTPEGSYDGFDIVPHGIAWCRRRISRRFPNFRFELAPIRNSDYNPEGALTATQYAFPYADRAFDFVFMTSVFTHMLPDEVDHYLRETARVLAPGGRCFITWFLLNRESRDLIGEGKSTLPFLHVLGDCLSTDATVREQAIAYDEERVRGMYAACGFVCRAPIAYGSWCGRAHCLTYQDIVVARKQGPVADTHLMHRDGGTREAVRYTSIPLNERSGIPTMSERANYLLDSGEIGPAMAGKYGVSADIHVDDHIFGYLLGLYGQDLQKTLDIYLNSGKTSSEKIRDLIAELQGAKVVDGKITDPMTILDFASGYGCVARHFKNVIPQGKLVAIDIHDKAMYFNTAHLGVQAVVSDVNPARVNPFFQFDVVFALSFFSHMPKERIGPWLDKLTQFVKVGGLLMFTTHGTTTHRDHLAHMKVDHDGYAFEKTSEQKDLSLDDYGNAITYPLLIFKELNRLRDIELVMFRAAAWWTHQDLYVVRKTM